MAVSCAILAHVYVVVIWFIAPMVTFLLLPEAAVGTVYLWTVIAYGFVCTCFALETLCALWVSNRTTEVKEVETASSLAYIIPAYMNNEWCVLDDSLSAYARIQYSGSITVLVVYNSKGDMSKKEREIEDRWHETLHGASGNIRVVVVKNENSTSKSENVNHGLGFVQEADLVAIMDADHHPYPQSASRAVSLMAEHGYDVLQGACTIRNQDNFLSKIVSVEFEDMYSVGHQGRLAVFGLGVFGGSNGYWKSSVLNEIKMDGSMLTEDIDSSIRATLAGYKIGYSSCVVSSELAPLSKNTLEKQRLRWAQGWAEVSVKYVRKCIVSDRLSLRQKVGMAYLLAWREAFIYVTFWPVMCIISSLVRYGAVPFAPVFTATGVVVFVSGLLRTAVTYRVSTGVIKSNVRAFFVFALFNVVYSVYLNYVQVCAHGRSMLKLNNWVATVRETSSAAVTQSVEPVGEPSKGGSVEEIV